MSYDGKYEEAIHYYKRVLGFQEIDNPTEEDKKFLAVVHFELGYCSSKLKKYKEAEKYYAFTENMFLLLPNITPE